MVCEFSWYLQSEGRVERSAIRGLKGDGGAAVPDRRTDRSRVCTTGSPAEGQVAHTRWGLKAELRPLRKRRPPV